MQALLENPLPPCPDTPNCVRTSLALEAASGPVYEATQEALEELGPIELYLQPEHHRATAVYRVGLLFKDDVTALVQPHPSSAANSVLHLRSASRVGKYDFGVNRRRVQRLIEATSRYLQSVYEVTV